MVASVASHGSKLRMDGLMDMIEGVQSKLCFDTLSHLRFDRLEGFTRGGKLVRERAADQ